MPSTHLKRADRGLAAIREKQDSPAEEIADTIEELVAAIRVVERRLAVLERRLPGQLPKWPADVC
jgi:hypothetical protein